MEGQLGRCFCKSCFPRSEAGSRLKPRKRADRGRDRADAEGRAPRGCMEPNRGKREALKEDPLEARKTLCGPQSLRPLLLQQNWAAAEGGEVAWGLSQKLHVSSSTASPCSCLGPCLCVLAAGMQARDVCPALKIPPLCPLQPLSQSLC